MIIDINDEQRKLLETILAYCDSDDIEVLKLGFGLFVNNISDDCLYAMSISGRGMEFVVKDINTYRKNPSHSLYFYKFISNKDKISIHSRVINVDINHIMYYTYIIKSVINSILNNYNSFIKEEDYFKYYDI